MISAGERPCTTFFSSGSDRLDVKVSLLKSLAFKLFAFISVVLLVTVGVNALQNAQNFYTQLLFRIQEKTMQNARQTANGADAIIESWVSQMIVITNGISGVPRDKYDEMIGTLTSANPDFLSFELLTHESGKPEALARSETRYIKDERFGGVDPAKTLQKIEKHSAKWVRELDQATTASFAVKNLMPEIGLPLLAVALPFNINGGTSKLFAILTVWQTKLYTTLARGSSEDVFIVDQKGAIISASDVKRLAQPMIEKSNQMMAEARRSKAPDGFRDWDEKGVKLLGAFARIQKYKLIALTESDGSPAYEAMYQVLFRSMLWAILLVLVAMLLSFIASKGITHNLRTLMATTVKIASGDFKARALLKAPDEVGLLGLAVNHMGAQLEGLVAKKLELQRVESELQTAKFVQEKFFPKQQEDFGESFQIASFFQPASECGGDWWGHHKLAPHLHMVCIADATGHGVPAALVTAMVFAAASVLSRQLANQRPAGLAKKLLEEMNQTLVASGAGVHTMTFFAAIFDLSTGDLYYSNAGHNFPLLVRADAEKHGKKRRGNTRGNKSGSAKTVEQLSITGTALGIDLTTKFEEKVAKFHAGDRVFFYTDGLYECANKAQEQWGKRKFLKSVEDHAKKPLEDMKQQVLEEAYHHFNGQPADDDITVVVTEIPPTWVEYAVPVEYETAPLVYATSMGGGPVAGSQFGPGQDDDTNAGVFEGDPGFDEAG